ncbi:SIR2 family protein [Lactobacillus gallinarum]|uniref:SIR2 family protein n=1 Tax=Lactobacillus gallinarum TaxID=52242 RepID=UPI0024B11E10|nr:SIR2 family protein [Lactobacillus gallinarum]
MTKKTLSSDQFLKDIQGKNLNFLIGAGASAGLVDTLNLSELGESFEDLYSDKELTAKQRAALDLIWFKSWIQDTLITKEKINNIPTNDIEGKKAFQNYKRFISNLGDFLDREGYDKPKRANIFTTNYDSLFELAFDEVSQDQRMIYFNDGSRGFLNRYISTENFNLNISHSAMSDNFQRSIPTINLLKIHGSITWDLEEDKESNNKKIKATINNEVFKEVKATADNIMNSITLKSFPIIDALFLHKRKLTDDEKKIALQSLKDELNSLNEYSSNDTLANLDEKPSPMLQEFEKVYKKLQVVNPTKDKFRETVFQQNYYQLLRMLSFELEKRDSVLIVFGFSFADEHILEIVRRSLVNPYLKMYVICYDENSKVDLEKKLGSVGPNKIEFIPYTDIHDGGNYTPIGNFDYLNWLFDGKSNTKE